MQNSQVSLFARDDTFFGVCEGLGEDLHIPANLLRVAFALLLFLNPLATIAGYAAAGLLVAFSRWLHPVPRQAQPSSEEAAEETVEAEPLPLAA